MLSLFSYGIPPIGKTLQLVNLNHSPLIESPSVTELIGRKQCMTLLNTFSELSKKYVRTSLSDV